MITSLGERVLPVANAGHASWQRPHSVHENVSRTCFQVRSLAVPAPKRSSSSGMSGSSNLSGSSRPPGPGAAEPDVDRGDEDVQVLGAGEVGEEAQDREDVDPHEHALEHLRGLVVGEQVGQGVGNRRPRRRPFVQMQRDPGRVPEQQADHDGRDQGQDQVGLAEVAALEPLRLLHLADPQRADHSYEHEHAEDVDEQRVPALVAEPGQRVVLVDDPDQRDQDRREEDREAPEDERVQQPRDHSLEQLALPEHDLGLVASAARHVALSLGRARPLVRAAPAGGHAWRTASR